MGAVSDRKTSMELAEPGKFSQSEKESPENFQASRVCATTYEDPLGGLEPQPNELSIRFRFKDVLVKESCSDGPKDRSYPKQPKLHNRPTADEKCRARGSGWVDG